MMMDGMSYHAYDAHDHGCLGMLAVPMDDNTMVTVPMAMGVHRVKVGMTMDDNNMPPQPMVVDVQVAGAMVILNPWWRRRPIPPTWVQCQCQWMFRPRPPWQWMTKPWLPCQWSWVPSTW